MKPNVGGADRVVRIILGLALLSLVFFVDGGLRWFGLVGLVPLVTGFAAWCPIYPLLGLNTCPLAARMR
ncbi:MAG TPA: DUF2892 domain-containing protein [Usitatibacter sp.]|nr:DUF2892 domain-containing protein [Usitatibacter sp.]